jgi:protein-disulfide isomerase
LGAIVAAVVVVAALVIFSVTGGDDKVSPDSIEAVDQVMAEFQGIPQDGATLGQADAPVEITEYGDMQCPACASSARNDIPNVVEEFVKPGIAKITFVPIAFLGDDSERGALGAQAAVLQDGLWPFITVLYHNQGSENSGWLTEDVMEAVAGAVGMDAAKWKKDFDGKDDDVVATAYFEGLQKGEQANVPSTPTFVFHGPDGTTQFSGARDISAFRDAIAQVNKT